MAIFLQKLQDLNISKKNKILLAVSGGADSMVLMDLLYKSNYLFSIAHCNFSLRGYESDGDEKFVIHYAKSRSIEYFSKRFKTNDFAKKNKISIQMAARKLRYDWFRVLQQKHHFQYIATAHHLNDSVETLLMNLIRGTGIAGLHGIRTFDHIIRPLYNFEKKDILEYAKKNGIEYRSDSSNVENKYIRNKIRNNIVPLMKEINPNVIEAIGKTISRINDVESLYKQIIDYKKQKLLIKQHNEFRVNVPLLLKEVSSKQILYEIISEFGFSDLEAVFKSLNSDSGKEFMSPNYYMVKDRESLIISPYLDDYNLMVSRTTKMITYPMPIFFSVTSAKDIDTKSVDGKKNIYIDYAKLKFPLLLRPWQKGDRFMPLGMTKTQKVSDYFINNKFSLIQKKRTLLLISDNCIVCILGERLDDRFKLVEDSKKAYIVKL